MLGSRHAPVFISAGDARHARAEIVNKHWANWLTAKPRPPPSQLANNAVYYKSQARRSYDARLGCVWARARRHAVPDSRLTTIAMVNTLN